MIQQMIVFTVILVALFLFIDGRIRYDFVAFLGLIVLVITGAISAENAFLGFSDPTVITVASVLVISSALIKTGVTDHLVVVMNKGAKHVSVKIMSLMVVTAVLSGFMNNIGALALIMPITIRVAKDSKISSSHFLMPMAFASLLGGMVTAIGTPPNLIISSYRSEAGYAPFLFFDFAPVGVAMVIVGIAFITLLGWRLIPKRKAQEEEALYHIEDYLSEVIVTEGCKMVGKTLRDFYIIHKLEINVLSIIRNGRKIIAPLANEQLIIGDILAVKAVSSELTDLVEKIGLSLRCTESNSLNAELSHKADDHALVEVVLREDSPLIGRTAVEIQLRNFFHVNLVAVSRKGISSVNRLKAFRFKTGDILLMQVPESILKETYSKLRCLPLAERGVEINVDKSKKKQYMALGVFLASIIAASAGFIPVQISFSLAAVLLVLLKVVSAAECYEAIEWPTIIMLGSLLPLGSALQSSGGSDTIANALMNASKFLSPSFMLVVLMLMTMVLTNLINNSAAAVLMASVAISLAGFMGVSQDPLLMGVCVSSSAAFLTPIGHQSNMLVMGPGGYHFKDYWRLGLPLSILILLVGAPLILFVWPF